MKFPSPLKEGHKELPHNLDAERALLGCLLYENRAVEAVEGLVRPEHFYEPLHGRIFDLICTAVRRPQLADPIFIKDKLSGDAAFEDLGGIVFVADLVANCPPATAAPDYARMVADAATRRALMGLADDLSAQAEDGEADLDGLIGDAERSLHSISRGATSVSAWASAGAVITQSLDHAERARGMPGVATGLRELDDATGGLRRGQLAILAARPGVGKSTGALAIAKAVAEAGKGVAFFSMEMPEFDLGLRLACDVAHDPYAPIYNGRSENPNYFDAARGRLEALHWRLLREAEAKVRDWPLFFDPRAGLTVPQMLAASRRKVREWERAGVEPGLVILDHLTIARPDQDRRGNKVAEVGDISRGLAEMAKTLDLPVLALCQLSRDVEKRSEKDRRPNLSDLRWSGEIEQDARLVMFLYRPEYYVRRPEDRNDFAAETEWRAKLQEVRNKLFWLIEKTNNGPTGEVETYCNIACSAIRDRLNMGSG